MAVERHWINGGLRIPGILYDCPWYRSPSFESLSVAASRLRSARLIRTSSWADSGPDAKLLITGHSLGGAAAVIAAVALHAIVPDPVVYTFGAPRVGNGFFAVYIRDLLGPRSARNLSVRSSDHDVT